MTYQYNLTLTILLETNGSPSYRDADISTDVPNLSYLNDGVYDIWCIDREISFATNTPYADYFGFSSTEVQSGVVDTPLKESGTINPQPINYSEKLDNINWLINQNYIGSNAFGTGTVVSVGNVQQAIWFLLNQYPSTFVPNANVLALVNAANAPEVEGFIASAGQKQGLVISNFTVNVEGETVPRTQPFLLVTQAAQLGDTVWLDGNGNGIQDDGETGIAGVTVKLLRDLNGDGTIATTEVVATTTTNANGFYDFKGLTGGFSYQVLFDPSTALLPDGSFYQLTQANQGDNDALDSDAVLTGGLALSQVVTLAPGEYNQTIDAGFIQIDPAPATASLGNFVWNDANANGVQDTGETGIAGVTVYLLFEGKPFLSTVTDENGFYIFEDIDADTYQVEFVQPEGFIASPTGQGTGATDSEGLISAPVTLEGGDYNDTIDAGFYQTAALGNFVWHDLNANGIQDNGEAGIEGATVNLLQNGGVIATVTTDANGFYQFDGLTPGVAYQVSFDVSQTANGRSLVLTGSNQGANDLLDSDAVLTNGAALSQTVTLQSGENNTSLDAGFYNSGAGLTAPGAGTPGFWHKQGLPFWDGIVGNESKTGGDFPHGELLTTGAGILVGDFNRNGITDNGEDTLFISRAQAVALVSGGGGSDVAQKLGRSTVASWLNYLAGNPVDLVSGGKDIADYLGDAVQWLGAAQSGVNPLPDSLGNTIHEVLDAYNNGVATFATGNSKR